jgi:hypothetical protein
MPRAMRMEYPGAIYHPTTLLQATPGWAFPLLPAQWPGTLEQGGPAATFLQFQRLRALI